MLTALTVFELRLIYQYLLERVFGTEQVPGTLVDRFFPCSILHFFGTDGGGDWLLTRGDGKGAPASPRSTSVSQLGTV